MAALTAFEQLLLELVNRARLDPWTEAGRLGIDLNQGLAAGTLDGTAKQPLAANGLLVDSARSHSAWMLSNDVFSHSGAGGSSPGDRMAGAGYLFTGDWTWGENIAWKGTTGTPNTGTFTAEIHDNLFRSAGHRVNILEGDFRELGTGVVQGQFTSGSTTYNAVMATENFAASGSAVFVTGVAITDGDGDNFYDIGEARPGVTVAAAGSSTSTAAAGGYAIAASGADFTLTFSGGGLARAVTVHVEGTGENIKIDLAGESEILSSSTTTLGDGALDLVLLGIAAIDGTGNGSANDLSGGRGANHLAGLGGADILNGGGGADRLCGGSGRDVLTGGGGRDHFLFEKIADAGRGGARDVITDFLRGTDDIDLSSIDAKVKVGGNNAFKWIGGKGFHGVKGELRYRDAGDNVIVEGDRNGDARADFSILVEDVAKLGKGDFIL